MTTATLNELCLVGASAIARQLDRDIELAARSEAKVLITGETGVGKDIVARLIHHRSARSRAPLATINCAGVPDGLLESELFGHVRGSFTGAFRDKAGLLEGADRGTAFLDEAGEMSLRMQGILLRFLETGEVQRVGCERSYRRVNVRIIAATNRDLSRQIASGAFREDLYYRLNVIRIDVAPLRDRLDDVPELFAYFADQFARQYGVSVRTLTPDAERLLLAYRWPGNVREIKNVAERLAVKAPGEPVRPQDLPAECQRPAVLAFPAATPEVTTVTAAPGQTPGTGQLLRRLTEERESFWTAVHGPFMDRDLSREQLRAVIRAGLERTSGNYRVLVELFNMAPSDYKRFLGFLRKHDCQVPFHAFRAPRLPRTDILDDGTVDDRYREAAAV
jgi:transcriptional regulator with GAF, ATPase, and Fis domain